MRHVKSNRKRSLQQLEGQDWGEPTFNTHLVKECHRLRRVPLSDFTVEDLRITIGQNMSLDHLVPLAIERLHGDPLAEGGFYPGDLLVSVLRAKARFWHSHGEWRKQIVEIAERAIALSQETPFVNRAILEAYEAFQKPQVTAP